MKLAWLTDIHLNFLKANARLKFYEDILQSQSDAVLITGDIAEAPSIEEILHEMVGYIKQPIYFVLGNHDYYRGQIAEIKSKMQLMTKTNAHLNWLPASGIQNLTNDTVLLGQDGWADGRYGDYSNSRVALNDSLMIADLYQEKIVGKYQLLNKMQQLADNDANQLQHDLLIAIADYNPNRIFVLTHVPPFKEACMHQGKVSNDDYLPYFSSKATGDVLIKIAEENSNIEFIVLCGHTHGNACYQPFNNLIVKAGHAEYYKPVVQEVISI
jgi:predicted MPP superfamily phosphohydrolase